MLSKRALELLLAMFSENSTINVPIAFAKEVVEIRNWIMKELEKIDAGETK